MAALRQKRWRDKHKWLAKQRQLAVYGKSRAQKLIYENDDTTKTIRHDAVDETQSRVRGAASGDQADAERDTAPERACAGAAQSADRLLGVQVDGF